VFERLRAAPRLARIERIERMALEAEPQPA
jgi:hypothetical protein